MLTEKQRECLQFIESYLLANEGVSPSFQEIANGLLLDNKGNAYRLIKALEERGFIRRLSNRSRSIEVIRETPANTIPIYDADTLQLRGFLP